MEYKLKKGNIFKDGHTMFLEDVVTDLKRLDYLESQLEKERESRMRIFDIGFKYFKNQAYTKLGPSQYLEDNLKS